MTTIRMTGKIIKQGKYLYIHPDREFYDKIRKLKGKTLIIEVTPAIGGNKG